MARRHTSRTHLLSLSVCSAYECQPASVTPTHGGSSLVVHGGVTGAVGTFVDMLSRQNYICLQPYLAGSDVRATMSISDPSTAATGSLTDMFGRVAAMPESQDAAGTGQVASTTRLSSPGPSISVVVSKMGSVTPTQPVTMFRIVGGPGVSGSQPHHIMAYRHRPAHPDQQPVLLSASAVRPSSNVPGLVVRHRSPFAAEPSLYGHQVLSVGPSQSALGARSDQPRISPAAAANYGDGDAGRIEAEAHELTRDASGREIHRCRLCARIFTIMAAFRSHVLTAHCRPKNQCAVCGKHFSRSWLLKGHMRTHTGERPYHCPHLGCDRAFADKSNLRSHLLIHNANGKHYVCTRCNRAFAQKRYLHKHRLEVCKI